MRFLPLILSNLFRRKVRTLFTMLSITVALVLFCVLGAIRAAFSGGVEVAGADRLLVTHKVSLVQFLPESYERAKTRARSARGRREHRRPGSPDRPSSGGLTVALLTPRRRATARGASSGATSGSESDGLGESADDHKRPPSGGSNGMIGAPSTPPGSKRRFQPRTSRQSGP